MNAISLVTGGAGFIGSHLCHKLLDKGHEVICVDNLLTGRKENIIHLLSDKKFRFLQKDVIHTLDTNFDVLNYIFHLASPASPNHHSRLSYHALPYETMMVNTTGTLNMLDLAKKKNARFLFASSSEIYGDPLVHPQNEHYRGNTSTTGPRSVYDEAKRFGETITSFYHREKGVDTRIARIFNTYGPRMQREDKRMVINFILQALANQPITLYGPGSQTRSLCYVDDLIEGLMRFMFKDDIAGEVINLGTDDEHTVEHYAQLIKKLTGSESTIVMSEKLPEDDPKKRRPDLSKAKNLLDWSTTESLEDGLKATIEYFKNEAKV